MSSQIPELERHCGSWIATNPSGDIVETFDKQTAETLNRLGYKVQTAAEYLASLNT